jgi:predicted  nucleic acid-binding Zn-ribbon protein
MKQCKECGKKFKPRKKEQMFCCHSCSVKYNRRHAREYGNVWI